MTALAQIGRDAADADVSKPALPATGLEPVILPESATILEVRQAMISEAAYLLAEQRGFAPGHELEDWLAAEIAVDRGLLKGARPIPIDRRRR